MIFKTSVLLMLLRLLAASALNSHHAQDVVARVADTEITFAEIHCAAQNCIEPDQRRLDARILELVIDSALGAAKVNVPPETIRQRISRVMPPEANLQSLATTHRAVVSAALHICEGENVDDVYRRDLEPLRIPRSSLDAYLRLAATKTESEAFLKRDIVGDLRHDIEKQAIMAAKLDALRVYLDSLPPERRDEFWRGVVRAARVLVIDPAFRLPDWKGAMTPYAVSPTNH